MKCQRCDGIMVPEEFYGLDDVFSGWRCITCGEIIDPVILQNRSAQKNNAIPLHIQRRHFEIISVSGVPPSGVSKWPRD